MEVFPTLGAESSFVKPDDMEGFLATTLVDDLYAVYRVTSGPNDETYYPAGEYAMLFERNMNELPLPIILRVQDGKVVRMDFRFGIAPEDILKEIPVDNIVVTPQEATTWMEVVR